MKCFCLQLCILILSFFFYHRQNTFKKIKNDPNVELLLDVIVVSVFIFRFVPTARRKSRAAMVVVFVTAG